MRTRNKILDLAKEYLNDSEYQRGWIPARWTERVSDELNLKNLSDDELADMWDMVYLTLNHMSSACRLNDEVDEYFKWSDVESAFTEVVNIEARCRR